jgi:LmbE family N-acetylglucosaminyl deacetylase
VVTPLGQKAWRRLTRDARPLGDADLRRLSPVLILAPHQDDETLGCGGLITRASALGLRPRIAYLTDGSGSHTGSPTWPAARLAAERRREALEALADLGVAEPDVLFLDWPDASPFAAGEPAHERTLAALLAWAERFGAGSIWAPWEGEGHCDHLAAALLARELSRRLGEFAPAMSFLVWGWGRADLESAAEGREIWGLACRGTIPRRRSALRRHRTQMTPMIDDAMSAFLIPPELAALTGRPIEIHFGAPRRAANQDGEGAS